MNELLNQEIAIIQRYLAELRVGGQADPKQKLTVSLEGEEVWISNISDKVVSKPSRPSRAQTRMAKMSALHGRDRGRSLK